MKKNFTYWSSECTCVIVGDLQELLNFNIVLTIVLCKHLLLASLKKP